VMDAETVLLALFVVRSLRVILDVPRTAFC
jgi:hypothetical protein